MNIALMSHDHKKELMVQFCTAYCGVLSKHTVCATNTTGRMVAEATGLPVNLFLSHAHGGIEQIGQRIIYNEIDMVLFFNDPRSGELDDSVLSISKLCDQHSVPMATNVATAELLIHGLARGDLDWREVMNPNTSPSPSEGDVLPIPPARPRAGCGQRPPPRRRMSIRDTAGQREVPRLKGPYGDGPGEDSATSGPGDGRGPPAATQGQRGVSARLNLGGTTKCLKRSRPNHRGRERVFVPRSPSPPERRSSISRAPRRKPRRKHSSRPAALADSAASQMSSASWGGKRWQSRSK